MNARVTAALLALAAAGCGTSAANTVGARLQGPTAIVAFVGATPKNGSQLHDYFAIASSRGDELAFLDPADEQPVLGPGAVFPLVVPTAPSPLLLAAAPLGDATLATAGTPAVPTADLLVAVSAGGRSLQLVNTWDPAANRIVAEVDLSSGLQAGIVSVAAMTVAGATPPQARVIVGAAGRQLAIVTFQRGANGAIEALPFDSAADVRSLDFEPRSMAVEPAPADPAAARLFVATPDPIVAAGTTLGVAQLTMTGAIASWPVAALDARAGTTLVAAARVRELDVPRGQVDPQGREKFASTEVLRVYAALDAATCGPTGRIACGLATLDPDAGGLAADPGAGAILDAIDPGLFPPALAPPAVPPQSYRAPVQVPAGVISGIAFAFPPANGTARVLDDPGNEGIPLLTTTSAVRTRRTSAVAALTSSDGRTYLFDAGRFDFLEDVAPLGILSRLVGVASSISAGDGPLLGLHRDYPPVVNPNVPGQNVTGVSTDAAELPLLIQVTPGFTPNDTWTVSYQGVLPGLANVRGVLFESGGAVFVAAQSEGAVGTVVSVPVAAPELGVRPSPGHLTDHDTVELTCPDGSVPKVPIAAVVPAGTAGSVSVPGGALQLTVSTPLPCAVPPGGTRPVTFSVRATAYVLASAVLGYAGRPEIDRPFSLAWSDEDAAGLAPEDAALARKARRRRYVTEAACITVAADTSVAKNRGCYTTVPGVLDPLAPGPVVSFELGLSPATGAPPAPDTRLAFTTQAGRASVSRRPLSAGVLPQAITSFDVTRFPGRENEAVRIYAAYSDDQVLVFTPAGTAGDVKSIR